MGSNQSHYIHKIKYNTHLILFKLRYSKNLIKFNKNPSFVQPIYILYYYTTYTATETD